MPDTMTPPLSQPASRNTRLVIGVCADGIALVRRDGWFGHSWRVLADHLLTPDRASEKTGKSDNAGSGSALPEQDHAGAHLQGGSNTQAQAQQSALGVAPQHEVGLLGSALTTALAENGCQRMKTDLVLADGWARYFMVAPPKNVSNMADCQAAAAMRFHQLYGESPLDWQIDAQWDTDNAFLACALPNNLLLGLQQACSTQKLRLLSITPYFIACWNHWCRTLDGAAWFGVVNAGYLTLAAIENGRLHALRRSPFADENWHDKQYLPTLLAREALRLNLSLPARLQLCGKLPEGRASETMGQLECRRLDAGQQPLSGTGTAGPLSSQLILASSGARQ
jgi:hypothetical protein